MNSISYKGIIVIILQLIFISCATTIKETKTDNLQREDRTATLRIEFENSQDNKAILSIHLCKELYDSNIKMEEQCEFKISTKLNTKEVVSYDLPAGEYFAIFKLSDRKVFPVIFFESTSIEIKFGFKEKTDNHYFYSTTHTIQNHVTNCRKNGLWNKYECPKLNLKDGIQSTFKFQIVSDYEFDEEVTAFIWLGSVWLSLQARFPIPLPLFMGSLAFKREIKHNLK